MKVSLCSVKVIPEGGTKTATFFEREVIALKVEGKLKVYLNICPHLGGTCVNEGCTPTKTMVILQMAMLGQVPYAAIRDGVFAHLTLAESLNHLVAALDTQERKTCHYPNR